MYATAHCLLYIGGLTIGVGGEQMRLLSLAVRRADFISLRRSARIYSALFSSSFDFVP
jgi:hypothetical protein